MKRASLLLISGLLISLAACQASTNSGSTTTPPGAAPSYVDQSGMMPVMHQRPPQAITSSGDYRHAGSGLVLPLESNGLRRVDLMGFDKDNLDISANYRRGSEDIYMTVYVFPVWLGAREPRHVSEIPEICGYQFEGMKKAAALRFKDPRLVEEAPETDSRFPSAAMNRTAIYEASGDMVSKSMPPLRSEVRMSCGVDTLWIVQYRISYPQGKNADAIRQDFMAAVPQ
jgi:hypothetical protein